MNNNDKSHLSEEMHEILVYAAQIILFLFLSFLIFLITSLQCSACKKTPQIGPNITKWAN